MKLKIQVDIRKVIEITNFVKLDFISIKTVIFKYLKTIAVLYI